MRQIKIPKILWLKRYLDTGFGLMGYLKYVLAAAGLAIRDIDKILLIGLIYGCVCMLLGWVWIKFKLMDAENEINNILNPFQREMRNRMKKI